MQVVWFGQFSFHTYFVIMEVFNNCERIQFSSSRAKYTHRLGTLLNWIEEQIVGTFKGQYCLTSTLSLDVQKISYAQFGQNFSKIWPYENTND